VGLVADPSGDICDYSASWLDGTPFTDCLIPGVLLLLLLGIAPLIVVYGLVRAPTWRWTDEWNAWTGERWAWTGSVLVGCGLVAWIVVEVVVVPDHSAAASILQGSSRSSVWRSSCSPPRGGCATTRDYCCAMNFSGARLR
jgi:hypothetical protein